MDGTEDDARNPPNPYGVNHHQGYRYGYLSRRRLPARGSPYSQPVANEYVEDNNDDEDEEGEEQLVEEDDDDIDRSNSVRLSQKNVVPNNDEEADEDKDGDEFDGNNGDDNNDDNDDDAKPKIYSSKVEDDLEWNPKKQKLKSLISAYEFAPRVPAAPSAAAPSASKTASGGRNSLTDWTERETFTLLDAWGDKFLQHGRKSLRSEEWQEVAEKVLEVSKIERTDAQCRNRLDTLKKKYKKEKIKLEKMDGETCKWVYFHRMDKLMSSPSQKAGLSCGLDSGEYVFMNPRVYLNRANVLDEMRDIPGNSKSGGKEGSNGIKPKKRRRDARDSNEASSFGLLANSIQKFSEIYEKIENSKRQQMVELEKMRMEFQKDLETQKRQILETVQSEISKLHQRDNEGNCD